MNTRPTKKNCGSIIRAVTGARVSTRRHWWRIAALGLAMATPLLLVRAQAQESVVGGTVFRTPGFMLPGARVEITLVVAEGETAPFKFKRQAQVVNTAGEYAFRVPGTKATYSLTATAPGFTRQTKQGTIEGSGERIDVNFELEPDKKR